MNGITVYDKETGEAVWCPYSVDAREHIDSGRFVLEPPENAEEPKGPDELSYSEAARLSGIAEKARLGSSLTPEERSDLGEYQKAAEQFSPSGSGSVPAPGVEPVLEKFNVATADRGSLFEYLRSQGEDPQNALGTAALRKLATDIFMKGR